MKLKKLLLAGISSLFLIVPAISASCQYDTKKINGADTETPKPTDVTDTETPKPTDGTNTETPKPVDSNLLIIKDQLTELGQTLSAEEIDNWLKRMTQNNKSIDEQIQYLNQFFSIKLNKTEGFEYSLTSSIKPNELDLTLTIINTKDNTKTSEKATVTKLATFKTYGAHTDVSSQVTGTITFGNLTFDHKVTKKGSLLSAEIFAEQARQKAIELENNTNDVLNYLKEYINIQGNFENDQQYEYFVNIAQSHSHGHGNYHFYIAAFDKKTGKVQNSDLAGQPGISIIGWFQEGVIGEIKFPTGVNIEGTYIKAADLVQELKNKQWMEQVDVLSKYMQASFPAYKKMVTDGTSKYDYRINMDKTSSNTYDDDFNNHYDNYHELKLTIEYKLKTQTEWQSNTLVIKNFATKQKIGNYIIGRISNSMFATSEGLENQLKSDKPNFTELLTILQDKGLPEASTLSPNDNFSYTILYDQIKYDYMKTSPTDGDKTQLEIPIQVTNNSTNVSEIAKIYVERLN